MSSNSKDKRKVLVTGGAGFIGSHLVMKLINEGFNVTILDNLSSGDKDNIPNKYVNFVNGDIRDIDLVNKLVKKSDLVFHLAEYIPQTRNYGAGHVIKYSFERPLLEFDIGCRGTLIVLDKCREHEKKFVYTSSAAVYGESRRAFLSEDSPTVPSSPYGASKLCAETYVKLYSQLYGMSSTILRLFNVYGPRQNKYIMYDVLRKIAKNPRKIELLGSGQEERDFIFVNDIVDAIFFAANNQKCNKEIINVGTGIATSTKELIGLIIEMLGISPDVTFAQTSWKGDVKKLVADIGKIRKMGFEPKYLLTDGLRELINWYKKN
ncbi:MAG: NAD-dependent epimerase/dehydratase family protein [Candidatus Bathyarchaeota archaeon]|nr:NAD-dependent epimerase/dehydratase family protein [Candidatus Bathyarchaeota archaeon]